MSEIELKLLIDPEQAKALLKRAEALKAEGSERRRRRLHSIYYDTEDRALRAAGITLRLRRDGRKWIQTVKTDGHVAGGLSQTGEVENVAPRGRLSLDAIPDASLRQRIAEHLNGAALSPVLETRMRRISLDLALEDGTRAELALDDGEIAAGDRTAKLTEAEIELIEGVPNGLYTIGRTILPEGGFGFSRYSKAARGALLAEEGHIEPEIEPRRQQAPEIDRGQSTEEALRAVLRECFEQIAANVTATCRLDDPEGAHQFRVGLRRLRSTLSLFKPVLAEEPTACIGDEAKWLGREIGRLRDLDVAREEIVKPYAADHPDETGFQPVIVMLGDGGRAVRSEIRELLVGKRAQRFLFDLSEYVETRGWLEATDVAQSERLARPVGDLAAKRLQKRWKAAKKHAENFDQLDPEGRHELRKELKKLRYACAFLAPLYPEKRTKPFIKRLKHLQAVFGEMNDAVMIAGILTAPPFDALEDASAGRAIGRLVGSSETRAECRWPDAKRLWDDLESCERFWK